MYVNELSGSVRMFQEMYSLAHVLCFDLFQHVVYFLWELVWENYLHSEGPWNGGILGIG